jgi:hypothetical protein
VSYERTKSPEKWKRSLSDFANEPKFTPSPVVDESIGTGGASSLLKSLGEFFRSIAEHALFLSIIMGAWGSDDTFATSAGVTERFNRRTIDAINDDSWVDL